MSTAQLRPQVVAARQRLVDGYEQLKSRHLSGGCGLEVCRAATDLRDEALLGLYEHALADLGEDGARLGRQIALIAHGGYGRCDVAPFSDVDLMILYPPGAADGVQQVIKRLLADVFDVGLELGNSVRTIDEACRLAVEDATICSSLAESRLLSGSADFFHRFVRRFQTTVRRRSSSVLAAIEHARLEERLKYGETVFLLEPNIKRSRGGLRDLQLIRWIGQVRYGVREPARLADLGILSMDDLQTLEQAREFLLRLRNDLHFTAGKSCDVLTRAEQLRIAQVRNYQSMTGMLPVEQFMREYFRNTSQVNHLATRMLAKARSAPRRKAFVTAVTGRRAAGGILVGPTEIMATRRGLGRLRGNLTAIVEMLQIANLYDKEVAAETWEAIEGDLPQLPQEASDEANLAFLTLLDHPGRLGELLREMHEVAILERFVPALEHARGLLQFNQYHKYTVDEHSFRAVEWATALASDTGPLGREYRSVKRKRVLHLALLLHDLGKGFAEDHCEVGARIAEETCSRLGVDADDADAIRFLVQRHLSMNHLAFRRDTSEEQVIIRFAVEVGSPELLRMLYLFTAADLAAVGPDTWTSWKGEVLTDLYHRAMQHLAGESPGTSRDEYLAGRHLAVRDALGRDAEQPWFARQLQSLPTSYVTAADPRQIADDLRLLAGLEPGDVKMDARYQPETRTVQFTIGTSEDVTPGIFHKLTGALTSLGLEILSAQINTLADRIVLDRFWVYDPDHSGEPPAERLEQVKRGLAESLQNGGKPPTFRRMWCVGGPKRPTMAAESRVQIDNATSDQYTIIDVFTFDRRGLLYAITRTLFELDYSVWRAKIGTYLDQVVDVFYVTNRSGDKVHSPEFLQETRRRLLDVVEGERE